MDVEQLLADLGALDFDPGPCPLQRGRARDTLVLELGARETRRRRFEKLKVFYLAARLGFGRPGGPSGDDERLLVKLRDLLDIHPEHARSVIQDVHRSLAGAQQEPARPLSVGRIFARVRRYLSGEGSWSGAWRRELILLRARLENPAFDPGPAAAPLYPGKAAACEHEALFRCLEVSPPPLEVPPPRRLPPLMRHLVCGMLGLCLLGSAVLWLRDDLDRSRFEQGRIAMSRVGSMAAEAERLATSD